MQNIVKKYSTLLCEDGVIDTNIICEAVFTRAVEGVQGTPKLDTISINANVVEEVMPYYGTTLHKWVRHNTIEKRLAMMPNIVLGVCRICLDMQKLGIQHTDIKPSNIVISDSGNVTLIDFNMCSTRTTRKCCQTQWTHSIGTWAFCAPEMILHEQPTNTSMIWSIGMLIPFIAYQHHPLTMQKNYPTAETQQAWKKKYIDIAIKYKNGLPISMSDVSCINQSMIGLYKRCMMWDHNKRISLQVLVQCILAGMKEKPPLRIICGSIPTFDPSKHIHRHTDFAKMLDVCKKNERMDLICRAICLYDLLPYNDTLNHGIASLLLSYIIQGSVPLPSKTFTQTIINVFNYNMDHTEINRIVLKVGSLVNWRCYFKPLDILFLEDNGALPNVLEISLLYNCVLSCKTAYTLSDIYERYKNLQLN